MSKLMVLVPTRSRPHNLRSIIDAWWSTGAFEVAQLRFIVDADDAVLDQYRGILDQTPEAVMDLQPRWQQLVPKLNEASVRLAEEGDYDFFAFMGDDHLPRTRLWAHRLIERHLTTHVTGQNWFQYGRDGFQDRNLPTWWSVDRRWIKTLGLMVPGKMEHLYCDNAVKSLAVSAGVEHYNPDIFIEHMHPVAGKASGDSQYMRVNSSAQYDRDQMAFAHWLEHEQDRDAKLLEDAARG